MATPNTDLAVRPSDVEAILSSGARAARAWRAGWIAFGALFVAAVSVGTYWWVNSRASSGVVYRTAQVERGALTVSVSATGTLQPLNQVQVGGEISGIVRTVAVDYNDRVRAGQVLARFDTTRLSAQIAHSKAALDAARANAASAAVTLAERERDLVRVKALAAGGTARATEVDSAEAAQQRALAALDSARAQVRLGEADLTSAEAELAKAEVRAPIDGIILKRGIEPGQTVTAALQAPTLFLIAEDLARLDLLIDVDEADAARVSVGQRATFTVEAFTDRTFVGLVKQVRVLPEVQGGVVTYKAVLSVDNADLALLPGMTATVELAVATVSDALLVPNAAFRFTPAKPEAPAAGAFSFMRPPVQATADETVKAPAGHKALWVLRDGAPVAVFVRAGATDGTRTEVLQGTLAEGVAVILEADAG